MNATLAGRKVLVTGGTRGIGRSIALVLAQAGADVVACYLRDEAAALALGRDLARAGGDHHVVRADVGCRTEAARLVGECRRRLGALHAVVNNAGTISHRPFAELPDTEWHRVVDTNLTSAFMVTQEALPLLGQGASVVNVGSAAAGAGVPQRAHYTAAKAGLVGLTRSLAKELGPRGVRVNVVEPGPTDTGDDTVPGEVLERYRHKIALGRLVEPEHVAGVVLFLVSDLSGSVSGQTVRVDGCI